MKIGKLLMLRKFFFLLEKGNSNANECLKAIGKIESTIELLQFHVSVFDIYTNIQNIHISMHATIYLIDL